MPRTTVARGGMKNRPPVMASRKTPTVPPPAAPAGPPSGLQTPAFKKGGKVKGKKGKK